MINLTQGVSANAGGLPAVTSAAQPAGQGFASMLGNALNQVDSLNQKADTLAAEYAAGGPVSVDQLMIAEQRASLAVDLTVQVRDRAVSAYQSIMNMQI